MTAETRKLCLSRFLSSLLCGFGPIAVLAPAWGADSPAPSETPIPVVASAAAAQSALDKARESGQALVADLTLRNNKGAPAKCLLVHAKPAESLPPGRYRLHALVGSTSHDNIVGEAVLLWVAVRGRGQAFERVYFFPQPGKLASIDFDFTLEKPDDFNVDMEWVVGDSYASGFSGSPDDKRMAYDKKREEFIKKFRDRLSLKDLKDSSQVSLDAPAPVDNGLDELVDPQAKKLLRLAPVALNSDKLPVHRMMLAGLTIERMCPVAIVAARTVPTLYKPGVTGRVTVDLCNVEAKPVTVKLTWTVEATKAPKETGLRHEQAVSLAAGEQRTVELVDPLTTAGIAGGVGHACVEATVGAFRPSMSKARFIVSSLEGDKPGESRTFATDLGLAMQWCPPGEFLMGSENGDEDEKPVHRVRLTKGFWMGRTEVTQAQWEAVMGKEALRITNPSKFKGPDRPVERVGVAPPGGDTFWHCAVFCRKLTERERAAGRLQEGFSYRLPTEAQWEYACRAGSKEDYAGDLDAMAWYKANSGGQTHGVAQKQANAWGLYDMHGNVWEWCADGYGKYPTDLVVDPAGPGETPDKVIRGGSWRNGAAYCRSTVREKADFLYPLNSTIGFRVVLCAD